MATKKLHRKRRSDVGKYYKENTKFGVVKIAADSNDTPADVKYREQHRIQC